MCLPKSIPPKYPPASLEKTTAKTKRQYALPQSSRLSRRTTAESSKGNTAPASTVSATASIPRILCLRNDSIISPLSSANRKNSATRNTRCPSKNALRNGMQNAERAV